MAIQGNRHCAGCIIVSFSIVAVFKSRLKTFLFSQTFSSFSAH